MTIDQLYIKMKGLKGFLYKELNEFMRKDERKVIKRQQEQLLRGKNIRGGTIQRGYSPTHAAARRARGLQTSFVDLRFTGRFFKGMSITERNDPGEFDIISDVSYYPDLVNRYPDIMGLDKHNKNELKKLIVKYLQKSLNKHFR